MSKRLLIWIAVVLVAGSAILALQRLRRDELREEGGVTSYKKSGDLIGFFVRELEKCGGTQKVQSTLPMLRADWKWAADTNGFQILLSRDRQAELIQCFTQAFGAPVMSDGYPRLLYRSQDIGATILAQTHLDPMHIICIRAGVLHDERLPIGGTSMLPQGDANR